MGWAALHGAPVWTSHGLGHSARDAGGGQPRAETLRPGRRRGSAIGRAALHGAPAEISHGPGHSARDAGGGQPRAETLPGAAGPVRRYLRAG
ncbi:hypothetical protein PbDSM24746_58050 [Paenibacillus macerans]|uniref:Uncharacterized protein n=1 Tax=Paenibacillus macerans TaxID=44252 RepID=A0A090Z8A1_PAEMA|nr:hypothetical protein DJ90_5898 [Paenibacillus macerans]GBK65801.1 hypothetical protein PbDSM24746_58050 [Paenibacillus macerans]GBK72079.1 hypothetical protein PbJCM17693_57870 [Paenibacillus macerans]GIP13137.1 hypothetical protein J1TS5_53070 [Paenibacillus macerans]